MGTHHYISRTRCQCKNKCFCDPILEQPIDKDDCVQYITEIKLRQAVWNGFPSAMLELLRSRECRHRLLAYPR